MAGQIEGAILQSHNANLWFETAPIFEYPPMLGQRAPDRNGKKLALEATMTIERRGAATSKDCEDKTAQSRGRFCPRFALTFAPPNKEGAGKAGCQPHPMASYAKRVGVVRALQSPQEGRTSGFPCTTNVTAYA